MRRFPRPKTRRAIPFPPTPCPNSPENSSARYTECRPVVLCFFTVYGPKPRPDQAVCIFARALLEGRAIRILGDGEQLRGMSYMDDVAAAILVAAERDCEGEILNVGGPMA